MSDYRPRFATQRPPDASTVEPSDTLDNWSNVTAPYRSAWDVWTRAVEGAQGRGPGVYDDEIVPAGTTLAAAAGMGGMAFSRPSSSIGAMGRPRIPISDDAMKRAFELSAQGMPVNRIASELGVNRITLYRRLSEHGIAGSGRGGPGLARALPPELDEQLGRAYLNQVPVNKLLKDYNVDHGTVRNAAKRLQKNSEEYAGVQRLPGKDQRGILGGIPLEGQTMSQPNRMMQMAQSTGGSPYDELDAMAGMTSGGTELNNILDKRSRLPNAYHMMLDARRNGYGPFGDGMGAPGGGSDSDMMMIYGPEDQVAYDQQGNPIRLDDPRHPRNQRQAPGLNPMLQPSYPQRR